MLAIKDELFSSNAGGPLTAESLANLLALHLVRHAAAPQDLRSADGRLPRAKLQKVMDYLEARPEGGLMVSPWKVLRRMMPLIGISWATSSASCERKIRRAIAQLREALLE